MRGFKSIFVSSKHKINCLLIQEKYFQTANAVDTLPLIPIAAASNSQPTVAPTSVTPFRLITPEVLELSLSYRCAARTGT